MITTGTEERHGQITISLAATFAADALREPLQFLLSQLAIPATLTFTPYNQLLQQLLSTGTPLTSPDGGIKALLLRLEDWQRLFSGADRRGARADWNPDELSRNVSDFLGGLETASRLSKAPFLILLCPPSPEACADRDRLACFGRAQDQIAEAVRRLPNVLLATWAEVERLYPVPAYYDAHQDQLAHAPYTQAFFAAVALWLLRQLYGLEGAPAKVLALDCDQTLWAGVCGEDGPEGVRLDAPYRALQEFAAAQRRQGTILALCSKNHEPDVLAVFERHPEMPLQAEHFAARRINWHDKPSNLRELAEELHLGLDSFVFLDDDPLECAAVEAQFPEMLVLQVPGAAADMPRFLQALWAFDQRQITMEDRLRADALRHEEQRQRFRQQTPRLEDFYAGLHLRIEFLEYAPAHLARLAQLSYRTNQFNVTNVRRSESQWQDVLRSGRQGLLVHVQDRFGDYGIVGAIVCQASGSILQVDTFLLSCRALGRGVEHAMLARLGAIAAEAGAKEVHLTLVPTARNEPARDFLERHGAPFAARHEQRVVYRLPAEVAAQVAFDPREAAPIPSAQRNGDHVGHVVRPGEWGRRLRLIVEDFPGPEQVLERLTRQRRRARPDLAQPYLSPRTPIEVQVSRIWCDLLRLDCVGLADDFFALGGDSLTAVMLLARLRGDFQIELPLLGFYEAPTVQWVAGAIERGLIQSAPAGDLDQVLEEVGRMSDEEINAVLERKKVLE